MKLTKLFFLFIPIIIFFGCSTRNYYKPNGDTSYLYFNDKDVEDIVTKNIYITQFKDGTILRDEFLKFKLTDGERVLNYIKQTDSIATIDKDFVVRIYSSDGKKLYQKKFNEPIVNASLKDNLFIILTAQNRVKLFNIVSNDTLFDQKFNKAYSINAKIAIPFFANKLIAIPTLDGQLVFITLGGKMVKNNPISNKPSFNNIIFLDVIDGDLVAATPSRAISIYDGDSSKIDEKIRDVIIVKNNLYFFTNDGKIIETDSKLNKIREKNINLQFSQNQKVMENLFIVLKKRVI